MRLPKLIAVILLGAIPVPASAAGSPAAQAEALWLNPHGSLAVPAGPCGANLCGWIVWANQEARADTNDGGVGRLVGTEFLWNYHADRGATRAGTVLVPNIGLRFTSKMVLIDTDRLKVQGCILGAVVCKSQIWIERLPSG